MCVINSLLLLLCWCYFQCHSRQCHHAACANVVCRLGVVIRPQKVLATQALHFRCKFYGLTVCVVGFQSPRAAVKKLNCFLFVRNSFTLRLVGCKLKDYEMKNMNCAFKSNTRHTNRIHFSIRSFTLPTTVPF